MNILESGENYLETILILQNKNGSVRSIDIARQLGFSKPSISRAMSILKKSGYIEVCENGTIILTEQGNIKSNEIYDRHKTITKFLVETLNISEEIASIDACRIEHIISNDVFFAIKEKFE